MAESITLTTEGLLLNWLKQVGDSVNQGEVIAEIEADKATMEVEAPTSGTLIEIRAEIGAELGEGDVIGVIGAADEAASGGGDSQKSAPASAPAPEQSATQDAPEAAQASTNGSSNGAAAAALTEDGRVKISPVARNMAEEKGVDIRTVQGSGPGGRIVKADIENYTPSAAPAQPAAAKPAAAATLGAATWGKEPTEDVESIEITRMRRAIADNTVISKQNIPHFYVTTEMDVNDLLQLRKELNADLEGEGIKISVNDMVVKAAALTLKKFPNLNSHYYGDKIIRHKRINIGIAVALPNNGLMNVVSHDADRTALSVMAANHKAMFERAREGKVKPEDIRGATFTVSNLGPYDVDFFSAIINPPEAGILAVASAKRVPVVLEDGSLGVGNRMRVTISVDHRVSDGAEGAEYMQVFKTLIENPMRLLV